MRQATTNDQDTHSRNPLAHEQTVRSVARRFFRDANDIEDVVQETWLVGLRASLKARGNSGAWYAEVARRVSLGMRSARARQPIVPTTLDEFGESALSCRGESAYLLKRLKRLKDPYRTTILLRFFEDLTPGAIAERMRVPVETVRTRLRRGLSQLEGELRSEYPERSRRAAWGLGWLFGWRQQGSLPGRLTVGALGGVSAVVALLGLLALGSHGDPGNGDAGTPRTTSALPSGTASKATLLAAGDSGLRPVLTATPDGQLNLRAPVHSAQRARSVSGQALDHAGQPVPGARVMGSSSNSAEPQRLGTTDAAGHFEVPLREGRRFVWLETAELTSDESFVAGAAFPGGADLLFRMVAAQVVTGLVTDAAGAPVAGARIRSPHVANYYERRAGTQPGMGWARLSWASATSRADGTFELRGVPRLPVQLTLEHPQFVVQRRLALAPAGFSVQLRQPTSVVLTVLDVAGGALTDARLSIAPTAEANGAVLSRGEAGWLLSGLAPEHQYVVRVDAPDRTGFLTTITAPDAGSRAITLRAGAPRRMRGIVLDAAGEGLAGALVEVRTEQESPDGAAALGSAGGGWKLGLLATLRADARGHFELPGLPEAELVVRATAPGEARPSVVRRWQPSEALLVLETGRRPGAFVCRVVDVNTGLPLAGARVGMGDRSRSDLIVEARSGADGRFELAPGPDPQGLVTVWADGYATALVPVEVARSRGYLALFPRTSTTLQLEDRSGAPLTGGFVQLLDLEGQPLLSALERAKYTDTLTIGPRGRVGLVDAPSRRLVLRIIPPDLGAVEEHELDLRVDADAHTIRLQHFDRSDRARRVRVELSHALGGWPEGDFELRVSDLDGRLVRGFRAQRGEVGLIVDPQVRTHLAMHDEVGVTLRTFNLGARLHFTALRGADPYVEAPSFELDLPATACRIEVRTRDGLLHVAPIGPSTAGTAGTAGAAGAEALLVREFVPLSGDATAWR